MSALLCTTRLILTRWSADKANGKACDLRAAAYRRQYADAQLGTWSASHPPGTPTIGSLR